MKNFTRPFLLTLLIISALSCKQNNDFSSLELNRNWQFREAGTTEWMEATVPGAVHTDLLNLKKIEDPFYRKNEKKCFWIERKDWEYQTTFVPAEEILAKEHINIIFKGLDTYAHVYLNDELLFNAQNMFIEHTANIKNILKSGENKLRVHFDSPVERGEEKLAKYDYVLPASNELAPDSLRSNVVTRKAPFHYGWDWGPRMVTSGIWRPVLIEAWDKAMIENCYIKPVDVSADIAKYTGKLEIISAAEQEAEISVFINSEKTPFKKTVSLATGLNNIDVDFHIEEPELWWTNGLGEQPLYEIAFAISKNGKTLHKISDRIGVRTIKLVQKPDSIGQSFMFELNGQPVFMKGANYIPNETVTTSVTPEVYDRVLQDALDANMNMLRVWGGAIYENDIFYDLCDEKGILVWQDFMFACAVMPPSDDHLEEIRKEAVYNVRRLRNHPCMALWCGNNENLRAWFKWGWKDKFSKEVSDLIWEYYQKIFCKTLPKAVADHHPELTYWPSSPSSLGSETTNNPACNNLADRKSGDEHDWSIWFGEQPFSNYKNNVPRFVSEYGLQAFPEMKTIRAFAKEDDFDWNSEIMNHRQRSNMDWIKKGLNGNGMIMRYILKYFKEPKDFESFVYLSLVNQAEGLKMAVESHRKAMPKCMGSLYWQINDCWPTMSWASVDYFGNWKASHYFLKKAFEPVIVVPSIDGDVLRVYIVSDETDAFKGKLELFLYDFEGKMLEKEELEVETPINGSKVFFEMPVKAFLNGQPKNAAVLKTNLIASDAKLADNYIYFDKIKNIDLPQPEIKTTIVGEETTTTIEITTNKPAKNIYLTTSLEGLFSDNFFDLLPGETKVVEFTGGKSLTDNNLQISTIADTY